MGKERFIWKMLGSAYLAAALITLIAGAGILPKAVMLAGGSMTIICGSAFLFAVWRHLKKLKSMALSLGSQALIIPADFRGTVLEEAALATRSFLSQSQDQLTRMQEESQ